MGTTARAEPGTGDENRPGPSGDRVSLRLSEDKTSWEENQGEIPTFNFVMLITGVTKFT